MVYAKIVDDLLLAFVVILIPCCRGGVGSLFGQRMFPCCPII